uniref:Uncharacterized protein n=1 Tax=Pseudomonas syringae group genomosp. 3 TaxID=251701 RepID=A0A330JZD1_9PSED|nr:hypothetical protein PSCFBP3800_P200055 [Pseudomonas syringae group genomosp. 3]
MFTHTLKMGVDGVIALVFELTESFLQLTVPGRALIEAITVFLRDSGYDEIQKASQWCCGVPKLPHIGFQLKQVKRIIPGPGALQICDQRQWQVVVYRHFAECAGHSRIGPAIRNNRIGIFEPGV